MSAMRAKWWAVVAGVLLAALVVAVGGTWAAFRATHHAWAWWATPPVIHAQGRDYSSPGDAVSLVRAEHAGSGSWRTLGHEWPMGWPIRASTIPGADPTVAYLCTTASECEPYSLEGGP